MYIEIEGVYPKSHVHVYNSHIMHYKSKHTFQTENGWKITYYIK